MKNKPLAELTQADELEQSELERSFVTYWRMFRGDCPDPVCEYVFSESRKFRFDFAWPDARVAVECQGIADHATVKGLWRDCIKMNLAICGEWRVFQTTAWILENAPEGFIGMVVAAIELMKVRDSRARLLALSGADRAACISGRGK